MRPRHGNVTKPLQGIAIRVDHRPAQFLRQQPRRLVSDAELILQLPRRHAVGMCRHEMRRPQPRRQRQLGTMHHRSRRGRSLSAAIKAFVRVRPALQRRRALLATAGTNKTLRPTPLRQIRRRNSPRRETSLETPKAIDPWPLRAPCAASRPPTATQLRLHTTSRAAWDSEISHLPTIGHHWGPKLSRELFKMPVDWQRSIPGTGTPSHTMVVPSKLTKGPHFCGGPPGVPPKLKVSMKKNELQSAEERSPYHQS